MKGLNRVFKAYEDAKTEEVANAALALAQMVAMYHIALKNQGFRGDQLDNLTVAYQNAMMAHILAMSLIQPSPDEQK